MAKQEELMKIAVPTANGMLCMHFGHCERMTLIEVDPESKVIQKQEELTPPPHEPGLLPRWLAEKGATAIIAGGMGQRAQALFTERNIQVIVGAPSDTPENLVKLFVSGNLQSGTNVCDH